MTITTTMTEYDEMAHRFLVDTGTEFSIEYVDDACPRWCDDKHIHGNRYKFTLKRGNREYSNDFWNSYKDALKAEITKSERFDASYQVYRLKRKAKKVMPTAYDVLTCLEVVDTDLLLGPLQNFMDNYGYENADQAIDVRESLKHETLRLRELFSDNELQQLQEIS